MIIKNYTSGANTFAFKLHGTAQLWLQRCEGSLSTGKNEQLMQDSPKEVERTSDGDLRSHINSPPFDRPKLLDLRKRTVQEIWR